MVRNNRYSVPVRLIGCRVRVLLHASDLVIYNGRTGIARRERLPGATALEQARAAGKFTSVHDAWWAAARRAHGDDAATLRAGALTADAVGTGGPIHMAVNAAGAVVIA